jgi:hypothetical protein
MLTLLDIYPKKLEIEMSAAALVIIMEDVF